MNILESLRKIENKIYREQDRSIDLQGMYLTEDVDKEKLCEMIDKNDVKGIINLLEGNSTNQLLTEKWHDGDDDIRNWLYDHEQAAEDCLNFFNKEDLYSISIEDILGWVSEHNTLAQDFERFFNFSIDDWFIKNSPEYFSKVLSDFYDNTLPDDEWHDTADIEDDQPDYMPDEAPEWLFEDSKSIQDSDGFYTEYTLWKKNGEDYWVCIFGDSDLYRPEDGYFDAEFESEREAREWFDNYTGFEDEDIDESLNKKKLKESVSNSDRIIWLRGLIRANTYEEASPILDDMGFWDKDLSDKLSQLEADGYDTQEAAEILLREIEEDRYYENQSKDFTLREDDSYDILLDGRVHQSFPDKESAEDVGWVGLDESFNEEGLEEDTDNITSIPVNLIQDIDIPNKYLAKQIPRDIRACGDAWWLKTCGQYSDNAGAGTSVYYKRSMTIEPDGSLDSYGEEGDSNLGVRPILITSNLRKFHLHLGDIVECLGHRWIYIKQTVLLSEDIISATTFGYDGTVERGYPHKDKDRPDYQVLPIYTLIHDWLKKQLAKTGDTEDNDRNGEALDEDVDDSRIGQRYQNDKGAIIQITEPQKNGRPQFNIIKDNKVVDCKDTDSYQTLDKILKFNGYKLIESLSPRERQVIAKALVDAGDEQSIKSIVDELYHYDRDLYSKFNELKKQGYSSAAAAGVISDELMQIDESLNERYSFPEVDDAIEHFRNDMGIEPDVDDVVEFIERNYPDMVPEDVESYNKWYSGIAAEISPRLNESSEESIDKKESKGDSIKEAKKPLYQVNKVAIAGTAKEAQKEWRELYGLNLKVIPDGRFDIYQTVTIIGTKEDLLELLEYEADLFGEDELSLRESSSGK